MEAQFLLDCSFEVQAVDPDGKKFDRVSRLVCAGVTENVQAAITANVWDSFASMPTNYESGKKAQGLGCLILELEETTIAIQGFGDQYIACLCGGKDVDQRFLRAKLDSLVAALSGAFERLSQ